jgi:hypothetical protein
MQFETFFVGYDYGPIGAMYGEFYVIARSYHEMQVLVEQNIKNCGLWERVGWHNIQIRDGVKEIPKGAEVIWFETLYE